DHPAVRGRDERAQVARVALVLQEAAIEHLQVERTPHQDAGAQRQHGGGEAEAPAPHDAGSPAHRPTITILSDGGSVICRRSRAIISMRVGVAHVACSSSSLFHSMFKSSLCALSASSSTKSWRL